MRATWPLWANGGAGAAEARKPGFRDTVNHILFASMFRIEEARPYRELVERLLDRGPDALQKHWLSLLIDLRNQAPHHSGWIGPETSPRELERLRVRLDRLPGGLGTSMAIVIERAFALSARMYGGSEVDGRAVARAMPRSGAVIWPRFSNHS